jgi:hypothetical protein
MKHFFPRILFCLVALTLLLAWRAEAGAPVVQGTGLCRFILHDYPLSKANEDKINFIIADLVKRHEETFNFKTEADFHIRIRIFGRFEDYQRFALTNHGGLEFKGERLSLTNLAGYYSGGDREVVTWRQHDPAYLANNILHECSHAIMRHEFQTLPIWVDEGCAVYFQFPNFMRSAAALRRLGDQWFELNEWLKDGSLPRLREFLDLTPEEFRAQDAAHAYLAGWSVFQLLMSTPENRRVLNALIGEFQKSGVAPPDCARLLNASYPGGLAKLEKDWRAWIKLGAAKVLGAP